MTLRLLKGLYTVHRFAPHSQTDLADLEGEFLSITRTAEELSVVAPQELELDSLDSSPGWACLKVKGHLDFSQIGILASLADPLARAGVSLFAISTYFTDYLMVPGSDLATGVRALQEAGHLVEQ